MNKKTKAEKREKKKSTQKKMKISGKSVFQLKNILKKAK